MGGCWKTYSTPPPHRRPVSICVLTNKEANFSGQISWPSNLRQHLSYHDYIRRIFQIFFIESTRGGPTHPMSGGQFTERQPWLFRNELLSSLDYSRVLPIFLLEWLYLARLAEPSSHFSRVRASKSFCTHVWVDSLLEGCVLSKTFTLRILSLYSVNCACECNNFRERLESRLLY